MRYLRRENSYFFYSAELSNKNILGTTIPKIKLNKLILVAALYQSEVNDG